MKKALITVLILGFLSAGGYGVYHHFFENKGETERVSSDAENAVYVDQISAITGYGSGNGLVNRFGGEVKPQATLEVKLENDRTVEECFVKEGDAVKEGQRLFVYNTQEDEDKLAQAEIDIERAEGDIEVLEKSVKNYEKDKANATNSDDQLLATTNILSAQNEIKKNEYDIKSKKLEMEKYRESIANATVTAEMGGIIQKISDPSGSDSYSYGGSGSDSVYITILADGDFRVKGKLNEQNRDQVMPGEEMIVYSRVDSSQTWKGVVSEVADSPEEENSDNTYYYSGMSSDSGSSNYSFYVELESSEGLILGQHVYMEPDEGQNDKKDGLWLEDYYILQEENKAYVWLANSSNVIEKHEITLGEYDEELMKYEVTDGLEADDYIAYPTDQVEEGAPVIYNDFSGMDMGSMDMGGMEVEPDGMSGMDMEGMDMDPVDMSGMDMEDMNTDDMDVMDLDGTDTYEEMGLDEDAAFNEDLEDPGAEIFEMDEEEAPDAENEN